MGQLEGRMAEITRLVEQLKRRLATVGTGGATWSVGNRGGGTVDSGDQRGRLGVAASRPSTAGG